MMHQGQTTSDTMSIRKPVCTVFSMVGAFHLRVWWKHMSAKASRRVSILRVAAYAGFGCAGDMMKRNEAVATRLVEDARVRVTRFDFEPGAETGWHRHTMDYVIVAVTTCHMRLEEPGGTSREVVVAEGDAYGRPEGVEHNVINAGSSPMAFVEVELK